MTRSASVALGEPNAYLGGSVPVPDAVWPSISRLPPSLGRRRRPVPRTSTPENRSRRIDLPRGLSPFSAREAQALRKRGALLCKDPYHFRINT